MPVVFGLLAAQVSAEAPAENAKVPVALSVHGPHADAQAAAIAAQLATSYRVVPEGEAALFIDVEARADGIVVEVRDPGGVISRQEISTLEDQRELLVWLVVRSALERAAVPLPVFEPPVEEKPPAIVSAVVAPPSAPALGAHVSAAVVGSTAEDLVPEPGARVAVSLDYGAVSIAVDAGYRRQAAGPLTLHALPLAIGVGGTIDAGARLTIGVRIEGAPKWIGDDSQAGAQPRGLFELSIGPALDIAFPLTSGADGPELSIGVAALGKLYRQGFLLDGAAPTTPTTESPVRAQVALGLGWRWG